MLVCVNSEGSGESFSGPSYKLARLTRFLALSESRCVIL